MAIERTLSIIKPDAVAKNVIGEIYDRFEKAGLRIIAARMEHLTAEKAGEFYAVHRERPFFGELVEFMTSGPIMVQVLEGDDAIAKNREIMGPPIRPRPPRARYAPIMPKRSMKTQYMDRMGRTRPAPRSSSFSATAVSAPELASPRRPGVSRPGDSLSFPPGANRLRKPDG